MVTQLTYVKSEFSIEPCIGWQISLLTDSCLAQEIEHDRYDTEWKEKKNHQNTQNKTNPPKPCINIYWKIWMIFETVTSETIFCIILPK